MRNRLLNERQVGAAIEGVLRQEEIEIVQLVSFGTVKYCGVGMNFRVG
jgi:hypothetical protein